MKCVESSVTLRSSMASLSPPATVFSLYPMKIVWFLYPAAARSNVLETKVVELPEV